MVRPLLLSALLVFSGCSTQSPSASDDTSRDAPDRVEMAAVYSEAHAGDALIVWEEGEIVLERAQNGYGLDDPHFLTSGTKSFAGVAALAAVADGHLSLDERVAETISAWRDDPQKSRITVRQLLHLTSGLDPGDPFFEHAPRNFRPDGPEGMIYDEGPDDLFMAAGLFNQRLYVVPSREMVVVRFGRADASWNDAEFLARLLDGRAYEASTRSQSPMSERVEVITTLRLRQLDTAVGLTEVQETALRPIVEKQMRGLAQIRRAQRESLSRRERRRLFPQLRRIQRQTNRAIEADLTAEQMEAYRDFRDDQRKRRRDAWQDRR